MKAKRPQIGQVVELTFLDHVMDSSEPITCVVYGKVVGITPDAYVVDSWLIPNMEYDSHNFQRFVILRKVILSTRIMKYAYSEGMG